ncbi:MAG: SsrA-binding protein [Desulfomicrobiaceae bacterium]|jgi:SsrA-binding protein|nr:SsrA-binding protein SmpB [Desulfomicrobiaceae bacterium]MBZ4648312.1 SsrA-binding protein [Desulfomicrobiaceae bacterium]MBZ4686135.1 SsrA-binding protein [Desulfomicrobiaceae bacterium]MDI3492670.1 SsrA-binding protein [Desulfomicrobiaceae bacterium]MDK2873307.1 SsrA-binding protein [Desulfomicrobiaceae bacterium]
MSAKPQGIKLVAANRKARHEYEFLDFVEAGLVLSGSEVKSLREGRVNLGDGYVVFHSGEAWLTGVHISPYPNAGYAQHDPDRARKLLLHRREIASLAAKVEQKGLTVVPTKMYFKNGKIKVELALSRGKRVHDRREELRRRAVARDMERDFVR